MNPPPLPVKKANDRTWIIWVAVAAIVVGWLGYQGYKVIRFFGGQGITAKFDQQFGDQHLKTAVALIELHKVRTGRYPEDLSKLRFTGQWDLLALQSVRYVSANDGLSYFVEVQRGWIGKPQLVLPPEFWQGTGFNPKLAAAR